MKTINNEVPNKMEKERIKIIMEDWGCSRQEAISYIRQVEQ